MTPYPKLKDKEIVVSRDMGTPSVGCNVRQSLHSICPKWFLMKNSSLLKSIVSMASLTSGEENAR
jgi:hypothetical protein